MYSIYFITYLISLIFSLIISRKKSGFLSFFNQIISSSYISINFIILSIFVFISRNFISLYNYLLYLFQQLFSVNISLIIPPIILFFSIIIHRNHFSNYSPYYFLNYFMRLCTELNT